MARGIRRRDPGADVTTPQYLWDKWGVPLLTVITLVVILILFMAGCTSITQIGTIGPKDLPVWKVADNDFLTASRMLVILGEDGQVVAFVGGTAQGGGTLAIQAGTQLVVAGAVIYGTRVIADVLRDGVGLRGIPSTIRLQGP